MVHNRVYKKRISERWESNQHRKANEEYFFKGKKFITMIKIKTNLLSMHTFNNLNLPL